MARPYGGSLRSGPSGPPVVPDRLLPDDVTAALAASGGEWVSTQQAALALGTGEAHARAALAEAVGAGLLVWCRPDDLVPEDSRLLTLGVRLSARRGQVRQAARAEREAT